MIFLSFISNFITRCFTEEQLCCFHAAKNGVKHVIAFYTGLCVFCQILCVYLCHIFTMLFVCILQFFNAMIVTGFLPSFVMAALLIMWTQVACDIFFINIISRF